MSITKLKPLYLMKIFREQTGAGHKLTVPELIAELKKKGIEAERKGIYRDIEALREFGEDIRHDGGGYYLGRRELNEEDISAIGWAVRSCGFISGRRTDELLRKLGSIGGIEAAKRLAQGMACAAKRQDSGLLEIINILDAAITERRQVTFSYKDGAYTWRRARMSPYAVLFIQGSPYVAGNFEGTEKVSCVQLCRIQHVKADMTPWRHFSEVSEYRYEFDCKAYLEKIGGQA